MLRGRDMRSGRSQVLVLALGAVLLQLHSGCMAEHLPEEDLESELDEASQASTGTQGMGVQGMGVQGMGVQGMGVQGTFAGATINGKIPTGYQLGKARVSAGGYGTHWYFPQATAIVNTSTQAVITPLAAYPFYLTGVVRPTPGQTFSGISGDTVSLRITGYKTDTTSNLFALPPANPYAPSDAQANSDVTLYKMEWKNGATWQSLCPLGGEGVAGGTTASGNGWATFIRGTYDATSTASELNTTTTVPGSGAEFTIACTNGVVAKCARQWGYKPWKSMPSHINGFEHDLRPFHQMCLRAARADYCEDGSSLTQDGTSIDMADSRGFVIREPEQSSTALFAGESSFSVDLGGASPEARSYCLAKTRYDEVVAAGTCTTPAINHDGACDAYYGGSDYTQDPSNSTYDHVWVGSSTYCSHTTSTTGSKLAADCNYCTRRMCDGATGTRGGAIPPSSTTGDSYCCTNSWDAQCVSEAASWCSASVWSDNVEWSSWETGDTALKTDWYAPAGPVGDVYRYDFMHSPKKHGPLGTAPFGSPSGFGATSGARWIGSLPSTQETGYFRFRFRGWKTASASVKIAAYDSFTLWFDGTVVGSGTVPGLPYSYALPMSKGKEHLVAVKVHKAGGGNAFVFDLR
jgi:hypothetical protein